jgi:hypothetical protein
MGAMFETLTQWFPATPRRLVQAGFAMFLAGGAAMFLALLARLGAGDLGPLAERFPQLPTWFVPESPAGYTVAAMMVCWGVWAMGSGLRLAREAGTARR